MFREYPISKILKQLEKHELLPAIVFRTSRKQCDLDLVQLTRKGYLQSDNGVRASIKKKIKEVVDKHGFEIEIFENHMQYDVLVNYAAGAHHAGQLLPWRILLEELMSAGLMRLLIATGTVAAGVDFPARSVVITAHSKRGHEGFRVLTSSEFQQMSGRAGRRGKDTVGFCFIAPNPFSDARVLSDVAKSPSEPLESAYYASPSTVLNLLKYRTVEDLHYTVENSLAGFVDKKSAQVISEEAVKLEEKVSDFEDSSDPERIKKMHKKVRRLNREAESLKSKQVKQLDLSLKALENMQYVQDGKLTEKGTWAAELCTTLVLELAEAINTYLLSEVNTEELVAIVSSLAGDSHRNYLKIKDPPLEPSLYKKLADIVEEVAENYQALPFTTEVAVLPEASATVLTWLESESWEEFSSLLKLGNISDGDAGRLITQTADQLQQIARLTESHPDLAKQADEARTMLLKPPFSNL